MAIQADKVQKTGSSKLFYDMPYSVLAQGKYTLGVFIVGGKPVPGKFIDLSDPKLAAVKGFYSFLKANGAKELSKYIIEDAITAYLQDKGYTKEKLHEIAAANPGKDDLALFAIMLCSDQGINEVSATNDLLTLIYDGMVAISDIDIPKKYLVSPSDSFTIEYKNEKTVINMRVFTALQEAGDVSKNPSLSAIRNQLKLNGMIGESEEDFISYLESRGSAISPSDVVTTSGQRAMYEQEYYRSLLASKGYRGGTLYDNLSRFAKDNNDAMVRFWAKLGNKAGKEWAEGIGRERNEAREKALIADRMPAAGNAETQKVQQAIMTRIMEKFSGMTMAQAYSYLLALSDALFPLKDGQRKAGGLSAEGFVAAMGYAEAKACGRKCEKPDAARVSGKDISGVMVYYIIKEMTRVYSPVVLQYLEMEVSAKEIERFTIMSILRKDEDFRPEADVSIDAKGTTKKVRYADIRKQDYIHLIRYALKGSLDLVSSVSSANGASAVKAPKVLTVTEIVDASIEFKHGQYTIRFIPDIQGLISITKLLKSQDQTMILSDNDRQVLMKLVGSQRDSSVTISLDEYAHLAKIRAKLISMAKFGIMAVDARNVLRVIEYLYPSDITDQAENGVVVQKDFMVAIDGAKRNGRVGVSRGGLSDEEAAVLQVFAGELGKGRYGKKYLLSLSEKTESEVPNDNLRFMYNSAVSILRRIGFQLSQAQLTASRVSMNPVSPEEIAADYRSLRARQNVAVNGKGFATRLPQLKVKLLSGTVGTYASAKEKAAEASKELNDLIVVVGKKYKTIGELEAGDPVLYGKYIKALEKAFTLENELFDKNAYLTGSIVDMAFWRAFRKEYGAKILVEDKALKVFGQSIPITDSDRRLFKGDPMEMIEAVLARDGSWTTLEPEPGEPEDTSIAKMLLTKFIVMTPTSGVDFNPAAFAAGAVPSPITWGLSALLYSSDGGSIGMSNAITASTVNDLNALIGRQGKAAIGIYFHTFLLRGENDPFAPAKFVEKMENTDVDSISAENVVRFASQLRDLQDKVNRDETLLAKLRLKKESLKWVRFNDEGKIEFIYLRDIEDMKLKGPQVLYDAANAKGDMGKISRTLMDAWTVLGVTQASGPNNDQWAARIDRGIKAVHGDVPFVELTEYEKETGAASSMEDEKGIFSSTTDPFVAFGGEAAKVYLVPTQLSFQVIFSAEGAMKCADALMRGDWELAKIHAFGTAEKEQNDGVLIRDRRLFLALVYYMLDPRVGRDQIMNKWDERKKIDGELAGSAAFWGMWEMAVLYTDYIVISNTYKYMSGRRYNSAAVPLVLKAPAKVVSLCGGRALGGLIEEKLPSSSRREIAKTYIEEPLGKAGEAARAAYWQVKRRIFKDAKEPLTLSEYMFQKKEKAAELADRVAVRINTAKHAETLGLLARTGRSLGRTYWEFSTMQTLNRAWTAVRKPVRRMDQELFGTFTGSKDVQRQKIASDMGVGTGAVGSDLMWEYFKGYTTPIPSGEQSRRAVFSVEAVGGKPAIKRIKGDIRCDVYATRLTDIVSAVAPDGTISVREKSAIKSGDLKIYDANGDVVQIKTNSYAVGSIRITDGSEVSVAIVKNKAGMAVAEISIGRELLIDANYRDPMFADKLTGSHRDIAKAIQGWTNIMVLDAKRLINDEAATATPGAYQDVLKNEIKPLSRESKAAFKEHGYGTLVRGYGERLKACRTEGEREAVFKEINIEFERRLDAEIRASGDPAALRSAMGEEFEALKRTYGSDYDVMEKGGREAMIRKYPALRRVFLEIVAQQRATFQIQYYNSGHSYTGAQMDTIISGALDYSSDFECSGGKTYVNPAIECAKIRFTDAVSRILGRPIEAAGFIFTHDSGHTKDIHGKTADHYKMNGIPYGEYRRGMSDSRAKKAFACRVVIVSVSDYVFFDLENDIKTAESKVPISKNRSCVFDEGDKPYVTDSKVPLMIANMLNAWASKEVRGVCKAAIRTYRASFKPEDFEASESRYSESGMRKVKELGLNGLMARRVLQAEQCRRMIERKEVVVDFARGTYTIVDPQLCKRMLSNRFEDGLHQMLEAYNDFRVKADIAAILSNTTISAIRDINGSKVFISGTMADPYVVMVCEPAGVKVIIQDKNIPVIDLAEEKKIGIILSDSGQQFESEVSKLKEKIVSQVSSGETLLIRKADGTIECPVKLAFDPAVDANVDEYVARLNGTEVILETGEKAVISIKRVQIDAPVFVSGPEMLVRQTVNMIVEEAKAAKAEGRPMRSIAVNYQNDWGIGEKISVALEETLRAEGLEGQPAKVNVLTPNNDHKRWDYIKEAGEPRAVSIGPWYRSDDLRGDIWQIKVANAPEATYDNIQRRGRVNRSEDHGRYSEVINYKPFVPKKAAVSLPAVVTVENAAEYGQLTALNEAARNAVSMSEVSQAMFRNWQENHIAEARAYFSRMRGMFGVTEVGAEQTIGVYRAVMNEGVDALLDKYRIGTDAADVEGFKEELKGIVGAKEIEIKGMSDREHIKTKVEGLLQEEFLSERAIIKNRLSNPSFANGRMNARENADKTFGEVRMAQARFEALQQESVRTRAIALSAFDETARTLNGAKMAEGVDVTAEYNAEVGRTLVETKVGMFRYACTDVNTATRETEKLARERVIVIQPEGVFIKGAVEVPMDGLMPATAPAMAAKTSVEEPAAKPAEPQAQRGSRLDLTVSDKGVTNNLRWRQVRSGAKMGAGIALGTVAADISFRRWVLGEKPEPGKTYVDVIRVGEQVGVGAGIGIGWATLMPLAEKYAGKVKGGALVGSGIELVMSAASNTKLLMSKNPHVREFAMYNTGWNVVKGGASGATWMGVEGVCTTFSAGWLAVPGFFLASAAAYETDYFMSGMGDWVSKKSGYEAAYKLDVAKDYFEGICGIGRFEVKNMGNNNALNEEYFARMFYLMEGNKELTGALKAAGISRLTVDDPDSLIGTVLKRTAEAVKELRKSGAKGLAVDIAKTGSRSRNSHLGTEELGEYTVTISDNKGRKLLSFRNMIILEKHDNTDWAGGRVTAEIFAENKIALKVKNVKIEDFFGVSEAEMAKFAKRLNDNCVDALTLDRVFKFPAGLRRAVSELTNGDARNGYKKVSVEMLDKDAGIAKISVRSNNKTITTIVIFGEETYSVIVDSTGRMCTAPGIAEKYGHYLKK